MIEHSDSLLSQSSAFESELPISSACLRNQAPIADVLMQELTVPSVVLELGSGTGQHAAFMTAQLPHLTWQPSDLSSALPMIQAWRKRSGQSNFLPPLVLDVAQDLWPVKQVDAVFSANVVHFISWPNVRAMMAGIGRVLTSKGRAFLYGPFNYGGEFTSEGNQQLDVWLRERDPESGIKDIEQVIITARKEKLRLLKDIGMPANNRLLVLQKSL